MRKMTLLETVQRFAQRRGLPKVTSVVTSTDDTVQQILGLLEEGIVELIPDLQVTFLRRFYSFTHQNGSNYKAFDFYGVPGFAYMVPRTLYDTTAGLEVVGPIDDAGWSEMLANGVSPAPSVYRNVGGGLSIYPVDLTATYRFEYISNHPIEQTRTSTKPPTQEFFEADTDIITLPSQIVLADLRWRWEKEKGLPYAESMRSCDKLIADFRSRETAPGVLDMAGGDPNAKVGPGLLVAAGSWSL